MDDEETRKDVRKSEEQGGPSLVEEQDEPSFVGPVFGKICGDSNDNEQVYDLLVHSCSYHVTLNLFDSGTPKTMFST